ncbi:MAG: YgeY family selenium metabolism-linked hydrolase [Chloroflexi bacterium]|nr:MAG: YgeY family selenium metabolism-linked hydrolase [Chloroflexota bacterium]
MTTIDNQALTSFLQVLVQQQSLAGAEGPALQLVQAEMNRLGFDEIWVDENGSVVGVINGAEPGPTLLFDAHCDTVGVAPGVPWQHQPFGAQIVGDKMFGRGTSDMKGALAAMIYAAAAVDRAALSGRVVISASVMEEVFEGGALKTVMDATHPDFVVIGESTDLNLARGGRGRAEIHLEAIGRPSHSSAPHLGVNAVHLMIPAIQAIEQLSLPADPLLGPAIIALTDIISDPYPAYSVTPSRCRVTYDRRLLAGETPDSVLAEIGGLPELNGIRITLAQGEHTTYTGAVIRGQKFFPAWKLDEAHPLVQNALFGLKNAGLSPEVSAYRFCTNAAYSAGMAGVPTIGFGPSPEARAHQVDEYIVLDDLFAAARGYFEIINAVL